MRLVLASKEDAASMNIKRSLTEGTGWDEVGVFEGEPVLSLGPGNRAMLATIEGMHLYSDHIDRRVTEALGTSMPEEVIFLSRHKSGSALRTLTVHPIGCYGKADFGGRDRSLVPSCPISMTTALRSVHRRAKAEGLDFKISFECTHHGPYLETPTFFIEIGSSEDAWVEEAPARVLASAVMDVLGMETGNGTGKGKSVTIGVGGGHYAPRFTDVALERAVSFGHMVPTYALANAEDEVLAQSVKRTPDARYVYFHRKAIKGGEYRRLKELFISLGLEPVREKDLEVL